MNHLKPKYHLRPEQYWINDPNGPVYWDGQYHLFFQYNPHGPEWGNIHWGHAVSPDLLRWRLLPEALKPGPELYDAGGIFSGGAVVRQDELYLFYTAADPQSQCLAFSDGQGGFRKHPANPLIPGPPSGYRTSDFRDPFVWETPTGYNMLVASSFEGRGIVFLYSSQDLVDWKYRGEFYSETLSPGVPAFECPLYFPLDEKELLVVSSFDVPFYVIGRVENERFLAQKRGLFDSNPHWYAPNTLATPDGRRIIIAWLQEEREIALQVRDGWSGCISIPRELSLNPEGGIAQQPLREIDSLRVETVKAKIGRSADLVDFGLLPPAAELELVLRQSASVRLELRLFENRQRSSCLALLLEEGVLRLVDRLEGAESRVREKELKLPPTEELRLRLFIDASVVEIFCNEQTALSSRVYPPRGEHQYASLRGRGATALLKAGAIHRLEL